VNDQYFTGDKCFQVIDCIVCLQFRGYQCLFVCLILIYHRCLSSKHSIFSFPQKIQDLESHEYSNRFKLVEKGHCLVSQDIGLYLVSKD
jgi:hypothetical protein